MSNLQLNFTQAFCFKSHCLASGQPHGPRSFPGAMDAQFTNHIPSSPWIPIPDRRIICIEHPAIIQNLQSGINTLGGEEALSKVGRIYLHTSLGLLCAI